MYSSFNARAVGWNLSALETVELAAAAGFDGVDLMVRDLVEAGVDRSALRDRMEELGLRGGAWPLPVDWKGDQAQFQADLRRLPERARAAAELGLSRTGTWVLPCLPAAGPSADEALEWHVQRLGVIARILADHDIRLGLEVVGVESFRAERGGPSFIHRLADLDPLIDRLRAEHENVGVLVDAFHLYAAGEGVETALRWGVDRVVWVHISDLPAGDSPDRSRIRDDRRGLPGEHGAVDCRGLLERLDAAGYDGPITAEPMAGCRSLLRLDTRTMARVLARSFALIRPLRVRRA
ncbi:hypothetical protein BH23PLA1_BH23PLA1_38350 [soil metagenome]